MTGPAIPAHPTSPMIPTSSDRWPAMLCCPRFTASSLTSRPGLMRVYHGLRRQHIQAYLDEFVFRFNRRPTCHAAFRTLLRIGVVITPPATYKMLISPEATG